MFPIPPAAARPLRLGEVPLPLPPLCIGAVCLPVFEDGVWRMRDREHPFNPEHARFCRWCGMPLPRRLIR